MSGQEPALDLDRLAEARGCYCTLWKTNPDFLRGQGLEPGYCGRCSVCGAPGHLRHHPAAVPATSAWCDRHYRRLQWSHPLAPRGALVWLVGLLVAAAWASALWR